MLKSIRYFIERYWFKISLRDDNQLFVRSLKGNKFFCTNRWAFLSALKEIYIDECYRIDPNYKINGILDIGANFGFSIGYFKQHFPAARITAFEADSFIFGYLQKNITENNLKDVEIINAAAWIKDEILEFHQDFSQGGSLKKSDIHSAKISIEAKNIKPYTSTKDYDLLKIDIEGSETELIKHIGADLKNFKLVFIEYHESKGEIGSLSNILQLLEENGFKYSLTKILGSGNLFSDYVHSTAFDLQLNIHAVKKELLKG